MNVQDESFYDTVVDVINYMVLLSAFIKDKGEESGSPQLLLEEEMPLFKDVLDNSDC